MTSMRQVLEPQPLNQSNRMLSMCGGLLSGGTNAFLTYRAASRFATLGDLRSKSNDDEDDSEDEKQDLFTGGEKS